MNEAQRQYDESPELRDLLRQALASPTVRRGRKFFKVNTDEELNRILGLDVEEEHPSDE